MDVDMNLTSPKVIVREACLRIKGLFGLSKDPRPKKHLNTLWKKESKEIRGSMKVENGGVHHKKYNGHCKTTS